MFNEAKTVLDTDGEIILLYRRNTAPSDIASDLGMTTKAVMARLRAHGIEPCAATIHPIGWIWKTADDYERRRLIWERQRRGAKAALKA